MEYYNPIGHETVEVLSCDTCFEPEWFVPFRMYPRLKGHFCTPHNEWRYGFYGSDTTYSDPAEALELLTVYERVAERYKDDPLLGHIDEVLDGD